VVYVFNKADLLPEPADVSSLSARAVPARGPCGRARRAGGDVRSGWAPHRAARTASQALRPVVRIQVPVADGKLLAALHRDSEVMHQVQVDGMVEVTARSKPNCWGASGGRESRSSSTRNSFCNILFRP